MIAVPKISSITCHKFVNSRGDWTIKTKVQLDDGSVGMEMVPEGASKGANEAVYVPVPVAIPMVQERIFSAIKDKNPFDQYKIDNTLVELDGTRNKSNLGGNSTLSVSLAIAKACAISRGLELYEYLAEIYGNPTIKTKLKFPTPIFNILNGGKHAHNNLAFQEFMLIPAQKLPFNQALDIGVDIYHRLKNLLISKNYDIDVGDEGGFAPNQLTVPLALSLIRESIGDRYTVGDTVFFGLDVAAGSFYENNKYRINEQKLDLDSNMLHVYYKDLLSKFELIYIEDPFFENDHTAWQKFTSEFAQKLLIVADDLVVTNPVILENVIEHREANAVIIKPNQIGTLSETFEFIKLAKKANMTTIISHRSGDTAEDTFIADLAVATEADFIKSGAPARGERVAKYNRLLEIFYGA